MGLTQKSYSMQGSLPPSDSFNLRVLKEALEDECKELIADVEIDRCIVIVGQAYFSSKLFSKRFKKNIPNLLQALKVWLLKIKNNSSLLTQEKLEKGIKQFLPPALIREGCTVSGNGSRNMRETKLRGSCVAELHKRIKRFFENPDSVVSFVSATIIKLIQKFGVEQKESRRISFARNKQDQWMRGQEKDEAEIFIEEPSSLDAYLEARSKYQKALNNSWESLDQYAEKVEMLKLAVKSFEKRAWKEPVASSSNSSNERPTWASIVKKHSE